MPHVAPMMPDTGWVLHEAQATPRALSVYSMQAGPSAACNMGPVQGANCMQPPTGLDLHAGLGAGPD